MKKKRIFISSLKNDFLFLIFGWSIMYLIVWWYHLSYGFFSIHHLIMSCSLTLLFSLLLSSIGNQKKEPTFGIPFINSYTQQDDNFEFKPGGFNLFIRLFYFVLAISLLIFLYAELDYGWVSIISLTIIISLIASSYLINKNDFLRINKHNISWYDNEQNESFSIDWNLIKKFTIINYVSVNESNKIEYPEKIIIHTDEKELPINLEKLAILQYSQIIIKILEARIIKAN